MNKENPIDGLKWASEIAQLDTDARKEAVQRSLWVMGQMFSMTSEEVCEILRKASAERGFEHTKDFVNKLIQDKIVT